MSGTLNTRAIAEAILVAARQNPESHVAELAFAKELEQHPRIMEARLARIRYVCGLLGVDSGGVLLDIGGGTGLNSVLSLMCGVSEVHLVEMSRDRLESAKLIVEHLGLTGRMHVHGSDVIDLDLPAASIDAAFSFELLEHIRDVAALYRRLATWVKPGSRVYGRTGANGRNVVWRRTFPRTWKVIDDENYVKIREDVIRSIAPDISAQDLARLVARTRGDLMEDIRRTAEEYKRTKRVPAPKPPCPPRDPVTGQYMERLLDPQATARIMDAQGFETVLLRPNLDNMTIVNPLVRGGLKVVGKVLWLTHPASLRLAPWLEFLSQRTGEMSAARARRTTG